eukprot:1648046-Rhodomonas_salina.1
MPVRVLWMSARVPDVACEMHSMYDQVGSLQGSRTAKPLRQGGLPEVDEADVERQTLGQRSLGEHTHTHTHTHKRRPSQHHTDHCDSLSDLSLQRSADSRLTMDGFPTKLRSPVDAPRLSTSSLQLFLAQASNSALPPTCPIPADARSIRVSVQCSHSIIFDIATAPSSPIRFELMSSAVTRSPVEATISISTCVVFGPRPHPHRLRVVIVHLARTCAPVMLAPVDI